MKTHTKILTALALAFSLTVGVACQSQTQTDSDKPLIYTSFYPMYDFTKAIVGDTAEVINLMPAGGDLHDFEPSAQDLVKLHEADVMVYQGAGIEPWLENVKTTLEDDGAEIKFIEAAHNVELLPSSHSHEEHEHEEHEHEEEPEHEHGAYDPHIWLSPVQSKKMLEEIRTQMTALYPANEAIYQENYEKTASDFDALDTDFRNSLQSVEKRTFLVTHEAFSYLAHEYGLTQHGITGAGAEQEPSPDQMVELIALAKAENISIVYYEANGSDKVAKTLANEIGGTVLPIHTIESPDESELGSDGNYLKLIKENFSNLLEGLK